MPEYSLPTSSLEAELPPALPSWLRTTIRAATKMATATIRANSIRGERSRALCCEEELFLRALMSNAILQRGYLIRHPSGRGRTNFLGSPCYQHELLRTPSLRSSQNTFLYFLSVVRVCSLNDAHGGGDGFRSFAIRWLVWNRPSAPMRGGPDRS